MDREYFKVIDLQENTVDFLTLIQISKLTKCKEDVVSEYIGYEKPLRNRWKIEKIVLKTRSAIASGDTLPAEWDAICNLFHKRVKWVKSGGKKLMVNSTHDKESEEVDG